MAPVHRKAIATGSIVITKNLHNWPSKRNAI
jgi:hypothetical protein